MGVSAPTAELSLLPPVSPSLRLPAPWSVLDKPAQHLPKEESTAGARRWLWRWAQSAALPTHPASCDRLSRQVAGGALLRLVVIGLCCDWPELGAGPVSAHRPPDDPPEAVAQLWRALCLRLYRRPTVPVGPVLATWNWRLALPSGRTGLPYQAADLLVPGAVSPLYCWPSTTAAPRPTRLLMTPTLTLAAAAELPCRAAALHDAGVPADRLVPVLEEVREVCETIHGLLTAQHTPLPGAAAQPPRPLSPVQRRMLDRAVAPPGGLRGPFPHPGVPGGSLPLALEAPRLLLGGGPVRHQPPPWPAHAGDADREQARLLVLLHTVGQEVAARAGRRPATRAAHARATDAWLAAAQEHARWLGGRRLPRPRASSRAGAEAGTEAGAGGNKSRSRSRVTSLLSPPVRTTASEMP
ncbi:hypothetical protein [Streptomyces sp. NPDC001759]